MNTNETLKPSIVGNEALVKINMALENPRWDFRTVEGIARETGLEVCIVEQELEKHPQSFRKLPVTDAIGRALYTHYSHQVRLREKLAVLQSILGGKMLAS